MVGDADVDGGGVNGPDGGRFAAGGRPRGTAVVVNRAPGGA